MGRITETISIVPALALAIGIALVDVVHVYRYIMHEIAKKRRVQRKGERIIIVVNLHCCEMTKKNTVPTTALKGWAAIAKFLGTSPASAQTWAKQGMPVKREGRFTVADPAEIKAWLGQQSHMPKPAHILTDDSDVAAALKESISVVRKK